MIRAQLPRREALLLVPFGVLGAAFLGWSSGWLLAGNPAPKLVAPIALSLVLGALVRWRLGVYGVLLFITVEGVGINLLYPSPLPILFKDAIIVAVYLGALASVPWDELKSSFPRLLAIPTAAYFIFVLVECFNPGTTPLVSLVGVRVLLLYIPLLFVGIELGRTVPLRRIVQVVLLASVPITVFGIVEYFMGPERVASFGPGFAKGFFVIGPEATSALSFRPASTFTFTGHFGAYLLFITILCIGLVSAPGRRVTRLVYAAVLALTLVTVVLQSQRANWVELPIAILMIFTLNRSGRGLLRAVPIGVGAVVLAATVGSGVLADRLPILLAGLSPYQARLAATGVAPLTEILGSPVLFLIGKGTGTALGASRYVNSGAVPLQFESGWNIPLYMFGVGGAAILAWLYAAVLVAAWRGVRNLPRDDRWLSVAILVYLVLAVGGGTLNYAPTNIYFWLFAGIVIGAPEVGRATMTGQAAIGARRGRPA